MFLSATIADIEMLGGVTASVRPSVRNALLTMFPRSDHHEIAHAYAQEIE